jgi:hypothetical protein
MEAVMTSADIGLLAMSAILLVLTGRILWLRDRLEQPADWSENERYYGRRLAWSFAIAAVVSGVIALYVASCVPWVENLPALLANPPQIVAGREPHHISTAAYLFTMPVALGLCAASLTDPRVVQMLSFRGPRDLVLRAFPLFAFGLCIYAVSRSLAALSAVH